MTVDKQVHLQYTSILFVEVHHFYRILVITLGLKMAVLQGLVPLIQSPESVLFSPGLQWLEGTGNRRFSLLKEHTFESKQTVAILIKYKMKVWIWFTWQFLIYLHLFKLSHLIVLYNFLRKDSNETQNHSRDSDVIFLGPKVHESRKPGHMGN